MYSLSLIGFGLQCHRVGHQFVIDNSLFLIGRIIAPEMTAGTEGEVFENLWCRSILVVPLWTVRSKESSMIHSSKYVVRTAFPNSFSVECSKDSLK